MDPIFKGIDWLAKLMGHSPHQAIVAVPIGAFTFSNVCDGLALASGDSKYDDAARLSMAVGLVGTAAAALTGLHDYAMIPRERPSHKVATTHALGNSVVGSLFVASYAMRVRAHEAGERPGPLARLLALAAGGLTVYTAYLGGELVANYGEGVEPMYGKVPAEREPAHGRGRLSPDAPLGAH